jgi:hypothetical protein
MRTSLHVLRKDLRHFWFLAALGAAFVLVSTLGVYWNLWHTAATSDVWQTVTLKFVVAIAQNGPPLVIFVLVVAVMQADLTVGDKAFWRTRPIARGSLLGAKLLFLFVALIVPAIAANIFMARSVGASGPMALGIVLESAGTILVVALLAALVASLTGTMIQAVGVVLAAALICFVVGSAFGSMAPKMSIVLPWQLDVAYPGPRVATLGIYGAIALLVCLAHQVLTLRKGRTLVLYTVMVPVVIFGAGRWPIILGHDSQPPDEFPAKLGVSDGVQIMLKLPAENSSFSYIRDPATRRDLPAQTIAVEASLRNVPIGRIVQVQSISSTLRFDDGQELVFPPIEKAYWPAWSNANQVNAICRELGLTAPPLEHVPFDPWRIRLFTIASEKANTVFGKPGRFSATLKMYEIAFHEEARLPAREGASFHHDGQRWDLRGLNSAGGDVKMELRRLTATTMFAPDGGVGTGRRPDSYVRGFVLLNRRLGEYSLTSDGWGTFYQPPGALAVTERFFRFGKSWRQDGTPAKGAIDDAWLSDAELVILVAESAGTFEKKVVLDDFVVPEAPDTVRPPDTPFWQ